MEKQWILTPNQSHEKINSLYIELMRYVKDPNETSENAYLNFAHLLVNRNIETIEQAIAFNKLTYDDLHEPFLMKGMNHAVERIQKAVENSETIMVYGDYDVDGTTSVALMVSYLKTYTKNLIYYIPDRYTEGYGISIKSIDYANHKDVSLIIALDCGIKAIDQVDYANKKGIDYIICDHHTPSDITPKAVSILNPKQPGCTYPYEELSGCGIGFKLCQALESTFKGRFDLNQLLDLVSISIACDIVPLTGENRVLSKLGLERINSQTRPNLKPLLGELSNNKPVHISDLVFKIGPKINAAGRISKGSTAVDLLLATDESKITSFSNQITEHNNDRKEKDFSITQEALRQIEQDSLHIHKNTNVLYNESWHKGVIGIVASRVIETHYKPTVILTKSGGVLSGSVRSVKGFDVYNALDQCQNELIQFGGHKYAAGLTLQESQLPAFKKQFEKVVTSQMVENKFIPSITIDKEIELYEVTDKLKTLIDKLEPFGPKNMTPIFMTKGIMDTGKSRAVGEDKNHLKLDVTCPKSGTVVSGIAFGLGNLELEIKNGNPFDMVYSVDTNYWNGKTTIQLMVKDIKLQI